MLTIFSSYRISVYKYRVLVKTLGYIVLGFLTLLYYYNGFIDITSLILSLISIYVIIPVSAYTEYYILLAEYPRSLPIAIDLFSILLVTVFISPNILFLALSWTIAELLGFYLVGVGERHSIEGSTRASKRFLFVSSLTFELSLFTLIYVSIFMLTTIVVSVEDIVGALLKPFQALVENKAYAPTYTLPLLTIGFLAKSAILPLHFWLPDAHSVAPAPASALLSGVMTSMGLYGFYRLLSITYCPDQQLLYTVLLVLGLVSIVYGGLQAYVQRDGKRFLAYSTIACNGFSLTMLVYYMYSGSVTAFTAFLLAVAAHMGYKTTLFLDIGLAEQVTGLRLLHRLRGLSHILPYASIGGLLALFSILGVPPTTGFLSKLLAVLMVFERIPCLESILVLLSVLAIIVVSIMIVTKYIPVYYGKPIILYNRELDNNSLNSIQLCILVSSLTSILYPLILFVNVSSILYTILYMISLPPFLILSYSLIVIGRRVS